MKGFRTYFYIQFRRAMKMLPALLAVTLLLCGCVVLFMALYRNSDEATESSRKYRIAIVGDTSDSYLGFGISALSMLDDSRFMLEFPTMTESEARLALAMDDITAYAIVPDGLVDSIVYGRNDKPITFVGSTGQKGITGILAEKLTEVVSTLVVRSQSAIYGMQKLLYLYGMGNVWDEATDLLNLRLIDMVLGRTGLCNLEVLGLSNGLSTEGYYFCSMLIFFLLLLGINSSPLFCRKSHELMRLMASRKVGPALQVVGEYLAYLCLNLCCLFGVFLALWPLFGRESLQLAEWGEVEIGTLAGFFVRMAPVAATFAAMQFLLYELTTGVVSSVMLQFICGISMAYLAGCFYPASMFPDTLKRMGGLLPAGLALDYADGCLLGEVVGGACFGLFLYLAVFLALSVYARSCRIQRG